MAVWAVGAAAALGGTGRRPVLPGGLPSRSLAERAERRRGMVVLVGTNPCYRALHLGCTQESLGRAARSTQRLVHPAQPWMHILPMLYEKWCKPNEWPS